MPQLELTNDLAMALLEGQQQMVAKKGGPRKSALIRHGEIKRTLKSTLIQSQSPTFVKSSGHAMNLSLSAKRGGTAARTSHGPQMTDDRMRHMQAARDRYQDPKADTPLNRHSMFDAYLGEETAIVGNERE